MMRYVILIIVALATCFAGNTQSIIIVPAYQVEDSLEYIATCTLKTTHDNDSLLCTTITQPRIYVESRNDKGFILSTANKLRSYESETTDSLISKELVPRKDVEAFVDSIRLKIQLDADCRPESIINQAEIKKRYLDLYTDNFAKNGVDINSAEWEKDTKLWLEAMVDMICTKQHLLDMQFNNLAYFNFISIPLTSGKISAEMFLSEQLMEMCPGDTDFSIDVKEIDNIDGCGTLDHKYNRVVISGKTTGANGVSKVYGEWLFANGIMENARLTIFAVIETVPVQTTYTISRIR